MISFELANVQCWVEWAGQLTRGDGTGKNEGAGGQGDQSYDGGGADAGSEGDCRGFRQGEVASCSPSCQRENTSRNGFGV